jgi:DNA-binding protein H-NS
MARSATETGRHELEHMSDAELRDLIEQARGMLQRRIQERLDEFRMLAREAGFEISVSKIGDGEGRRGRRRRSAEAGGEGGDQRSAVAPKYRNPDNASETWSGRGRKPKWLEEKIAGGKSVDDFLIGSGREERHPAAAAEA